MQPDEYVVEYEVQVMRLRYETIRTYVGRACDLLVSNKAHRL